MVQIKLLKSLMVQGSRLLAPGTILEHPRAEALIAKGVAVAVAVAEPIVAEDGDDEEDEVDVDDGEDADEVDDKPRRKGKGKKKPAAETTEE